MALAENTNENVRENQTASFLPHLVTVRSQDRRSFQYPRIVLGDDEIEWKKSIKYLRVQLD